MRRAIGPIVVLVFVSVQGGILGAQTEKPATAKKPAQAGKAAIPVDAETREKIRASFATHAGSAANAWDRAEAALAKALVAGSEADINKATADLKASGARLETAKKTVAAELQPAGVSTALLQQEWTAWLAQRDAAKK